MEQAKKQYQKDFQMIQISLDDMEEKLAEENKEDIQQSYEKMCELLRRLDISKDELTRCMLDEDKENTLQEVREWLKKQKEELKSATDMKKQLKEKLDGMENADWDMKQEREYQHQRRMNEEQLKIQREREEVALRQQEREEEWYRRRLAMEEQLGSRERQTSETGSTQSVKLQKYTITKFAGNYKDWLRFWNQFTVEVDGSNISSISKFNYLVELLEGKPREDILGLPHTVEGYEEAKRILKETYGKDIKVHKALIKEIENLQEIHSIHKQREIHEFYNKLARVVRTLSTMKKLNTAQSTTYTLLDKLGPVREILTQKDDKWEEWGLEELVENLRRYVERNPLQVSEETKGSYVAGNQREQPRRADEQKRDDRGMTKKFHQQQQQQQQQNQRRGNVCVYCGQQNHRSNDCTKVLDIARRKDILQKNRLCFNCTGFGHLATQCRSRGCNRCGGKHHTSICTEERSTLSGGRGNHKEVMGAVADGNLTIHPTVVAKIKDKRVRIMLDSGAGSSYICTELLTLLNLKPIRKEKKCIEQMYGTINKEVEVYKVKISSLHFEEYSTEIECTNAEKDILTYLPNPRIKEIKKRYGRLRQLRFSDDVGDDENLLPIHMILGAADYQRIKTTEPAVLGKDPDKDPGAELTMLGWTLVGKLAQSTCETEKGFFLTTSRDEFEQMCSLEVLGLSDTTDQTSLFHEDFKQHLKQHQQGYYITRLPWKKDIGDLPSNKELTMARLRSTTKRLEKLNKLEEYDKVMREQMEEGILEEIPQKQTGKIIHYIPHQPVIRENAETTKIRVVYDCSARKDAHSPSLNDCLDIGPSLQPLIFDILIRNRMRKYCVLADIKKAFLQIRVDHADRDALRLMWYDNLKDRRLIELRFTRVIFGSGPSPYILGATIEKHTDKYEVMYPKTVKSLKEDTYVDDIQSGGETKEELIRFKQEARAIMEEGGFQLHKWHSNVKEVEEEEKEITKEISKVEEEFQTYAKSSVGVKQDETKILGIPWNKERDELSIEFTTCIKKGSGEILTKRKMLSAINSIFDILGITSPVMIVGKILYSQVCLQKLRWDEKVSEDTSKSWIRWIKLLKNKKSISIPRCVLVDKVLKLELHGFSDASKLAICAAVYVLVTYPTYQKQRNLLVAKSRIAPKNLTIPRLELVAAHHLCRLMTHVLKTLSRWNISECHAWVDSTTVLYWLQEKGTWTQFVRNRAQAIRKNESIEWHYVPTKENPSDIGSRGVGPEKLTDTWFRGPEWLESQEEWPTQPEVLETKEVKEEKIAQKDKLTFMKVEDINSLQKLLDKYNYWKVLRITCFVRRFINNCSTKVKKIGPLTTEEITEAEKNWIRIVQNTTEVLTSQMEVKKDEDQVSRCYGRVSGYHPVFLPRNHKLVELIIQHYHERTLHGGVGTTMAKIREKFWIPKLRALVKKKVHRCNLCKRYRIKSLQSPPESVLPTFRTEDIEPFAVTGVDFAGPLLYKAKNCFEKCYIALFTCASTRAVHLRLCPNLSAEEFKKAMKEFVARRGPPQMMVSDNAKTFIATGKWLKTLKRDENLANYLASQSIKWRFNLARAPWWGGMFERLVGIMKNTLSKVVGKGLLSYSELEEVLLDVECCMNNRPLCYQGEDFEQEVLTPNILLRGRPTRLLEENLDELEEEDCGIKRLKFVRKCKEHVKRRWMGEYILALEDRCRKKNINQQILPHLGSIVLLKGDVKHRAQWKIGRIEGMIKGKDSVVRGMKVRLGNGYVVERPLEHVCNLEINTAVSDAASDDISDKTNDDDVNDKNTILRPTRQAKEEAKKRINEISKYENEDE